MIGAIPVCMAPPLRGFKEITAADAGDGKIEQRRKMKANKCWQDQEMMACVCTCSNIQRGLRCFFMLSKCEGMGLAPPNIQKTCFNSREAGGKSSDIACTKLIGLRCLARICF